MGDDQGKTKVEKIDSFTALSQPIYLRIEHSLLLQVILGIVTVIALLGSSLVDTLLLGPLPLPKPESVSILGGIFTNLVVFTFQFLLLYELSTYLGKKRPWSVLRSLMVANSLNYSVVVLILLIFKVVGLTQLPLLGIIPWFVLSSLSQAFFVLIITGSLILGHGISIERSVIVSLLLLYFSVSLSLVLRYL